MAPGSARPPSIPTWSGPSSPPCPRARGWRPASLGNNAEPPSPMTRLLLAPPLLLVPPPPLHAQPADAIAPIAPAQCAHMRQHHVMNPPAPVPCERLRLVTFTHIGFD